MDDGGNRRALRVQFGRWREDGGESRDSAARRGDEGSEKPALARGDGSTRFEECSNVGVFLRAGRIQGVTAVGARGVDVGAKLHGQLNGFEYQRVPFGAF